MHVNFPRTWNCFYKSFLYILILLYHEHKLTALGTWTVKCRILFNWMGIVPSVLIQVLMSWLTFYPEGINPKLLTWELYITLHKGDCNWNNWFNLLISHWVLFNVLKMRALKINTTLYFLNKIINKTVHLKIHTSKSLMRAFVDSGTWYKGPAVF